MDSHRRAVKTHREKKISEGFQLKTFLLTPKAIKGLARRKRKTGLSGQAIINEFLEGPDHG